jgi:general secretion pathway protein H
MKTQLNFNQRFEKMPAAFSLIEILIAMAIMAVMIGIAVPYLGGSSDKYAKKEINRLLAAIEMVRDLAVIENKEYGLNIDDKGYQFLVLNEDDLSRPAQWQVIAEHPELSAHEFPDTVEVNISIDGDNIFAAKEDEIEIFEEDVDIFEDEEEVEKIEPPQIYFLSTSEQNQFSIAIAPGQDYQDEADSAKFFRIQGNLIGQLKYQGPLEGNLFSDIDREYDEQNAPPKRFENRQ